MKKNFIIFISIFIIVLSAPCVFAATKSEVVTPDKLNFNMYEAAEVKGTTLKGNAGVMGGLNGGFVVNEKYVVGVAGYLLLSSVDSKDIVDHGTGSRVDFGYWGLFLEYLSDYKKLHYYSISALLGGGGMNSSYYSQGTKRSDNAIFYVFEPSINYNVNFSEFTRLNAGIGYRIVASAKSDVVSAGDLSGPAVTFSIRFANW